MTPVHLQPLLDGMLEAVWLVDPIDLRVVAANPAAEALLGVPSGALCGRSAVELIDTPEDQAFWEDAAAGLCDRILSETLVRRADGRTVPVERRICRVRIPPAWSAYMVALRDRSEQQEAQDALEKLVAELRATLESTADGILAVDLHGAIRGYNQRFAELWGLPRSLLTRRDDDAVYAWMSHSVIDGPAYEQRLQVIAREPLMEATDTLVLRSGKVLERNTLPQYSRGKPIGRVYSFRDITQRLADESRLQLAAKVFEASLDAIIVTDASGRVVAANPSCERLTGCSRQALVGRSLRELLTDGDGGDTIARVRERLDVHGHWEGELHHFRQQGEGGPCHVALVRLPDEAGRTLHYIAFVKDLADKLAAKQRIEELAYTDALTGLPNRQVLSERTEFALALARRDNQPFAVLSVDLDRFKHINDSLGHPFGDRVLVEVAHRIRSCVREVDTVARLGGDEFVLLIHQADARGAELAARRVLAALNEPLVLDDMSFTVTCSIGIALHPNDGATLEDLIKNADAAMYRVKERGRAGFRFYQPQMNVDLLSRMKIDQAMRQALARGGFRLHYQPQVDIRTGAIVGAEALVRWHDEELGELSPARFIQVAEESGFIVPLGEWVLTEAVRQAAQWHRRGLDLVVAVNVSAVQFQRSNFVERVAAIIAAAGLPARNLELELTESILIQDADEALLRLNALAALGVRLAIDDFGTGYSSLGYLKRFPLRKLKIDRSFIQGLPADESDAGIVRSIVYLARALRLSLIAEGVETEAQRQFLLQAGCDEFQGFLFSPAVESAAFDALLEREALPAGAADDLALPG
ncbi:EAL domain-containing protein [Caldimonas thermodepolymerans]|uniref:Diguanylate cyclase n=1 Tax=Caldimonas thermodepolymerans TaxID=215580 RepID=A0A2S5T013_9BURK|nr:bifunctional diguanylate cyclase/phosphodiesterase [Caldimonas thermodepolymerans]PPE68365.1 diguanylate cyclase [Caldimonas thermodepolymerans]QPC30149.1 EAL domain-containing protein [Caldimonas thermodepolymerans]RDI00530.1 diguanylate cyclase/phosphodiesterase with PAS/PAC sensor(s) [Caldimonas thermodepolymerans]